MSELEHIRQAIVQCVSKSRYRMTRPDIGREIRKRFPVGRKEISAALKSLLAENELKYTNPDGHSFIEISIDKAVRIGSRMILKPPAIASDACGDDIVINLSAGASFGSGSHPTTRLALAAMEYALCEKSFLKNKARTCALDIGTGSGVLAIAAVKMGMGSALGIDIDPCARAEASENVRLNSLGHKIVIDGRDVETINRQFSMILANLRLPTLKRLYPKISELVEPGGVLIVSGIYTDEIAETDSLYADRFVREWENDTNGWTALIYRS